MGWSGGTFTRVHDWTEDEAGGYDILSTRMDEEDDNFETGINACLTKDGTNSPTDNLPMGGKKHTGVGNGTAVDDYAAVGQVQNSAFQYGPCVGSLNAYALTLTPAITSYAAGQMFSFLSPRTNSGASTLNVNFIGAKNIYANGAPLTSGMIVVNRVYTVVYDGTQFHLISGAGSGGASYGGAKICSTSSQTLPTFGTKTTVTLRVEVYDDSSYHAPNTDSFTIPVTGRYRLSGGVIIESRSGASAEPDEYQYTACAAFAINSVFQTASANSVEAGPYSVAALVSLGSSPWCIPVHWEGPLTAADVVTLQVFFMDPGGREATLYGDGLQHSSCWMAIERIL